RHEWGDGVGHGAQAVHGHAGGNAHHVGFSDAAVEEAAGMLVLELVEQAFADVARQHDDARVLVTELGQFVGECVSHDRPSSLCALTTSSSVVARYVRV